MGSGEFGRATSGGSKLESHQLACAEPRAVTEVSTDTPSVLGEFQTDHLVFFHGRPLINALTHSRLVCEAFQRISISRNWENTFSPEVQGGFDSFDSFYLLCRGGSITGRHANQPGACTKVICLAGEKLWVICNDGEVYNRRLQSALLTPSSRL